MTWQPRVTVGDDLARLHDSSRAADMSRDLGYSSISMGEGSLDLIVGDDADNTRVVLGDQSDGRFGIGLWHRGGMKYLPDVLESAEDRIAAAEDKNGRQDRRLDALDDDVVRIDEKNGQQDGRLTGAEGRLTGAEGRLGSAEGRLDGVEGRMGSAEGRLDGHDGTLSSHSTRISNAQSSANNAQSDADKAQAAAAAAASAASAAQTRADNAYSRAETAKDRADDAYALAGTKTTKTYVDGLHNSQDEKIDARVSQLMAAIRLVASRSDQPDPFM